MMYDGEYLTEVSSDKPQLFDPPKVMFVWDDEKLGIPSLKEIRCYDPTIPVPFLESDYVRRWRHGAFISESMIEKIKPKCENHNPYMDEDVRVMDDYLACWNSAEKTWDKILDHLPYRWGDSI